MTDEIKNRSLRLLIDLQACQTEGSGPRGVGRYSKALFSNLAMAAQERDLFVHLANHLPLPVDLGGHSESRVVRSPAMLQWNTPRSFQGGEQDILDSLALSAYLAPLKPDIIHVSHAFEGFSERVALPSISQRAAGQIISATLYDFIPLLFQDHYFQNKNFRNWYTSRLAWLQQADLLLAISESTRQDGINLLGIDPTRIVTIHGGVSSHFVPVLDRYKARQKLSEKYGLHKKGFVLYTGGDDYRKNIQGLIKGFAATPLEIRKDYQLVVVCNMPEHRKKMYENEARTAGLLPADLVITGFVSEADLVAFYGTCDLFVFPSLYEGLGLPVIEAMACGAPVIGGNNSSIKELIARPDALFDAESTQSIGNAIANAIGNRAFSENLREYGLQRSKDFSWKKTVGQALEAFDEAAKRSRQSGVQAVIQGWLPRKRLAMFTPLPPCRSGIADYNAQFLPYLARYFEIDLYVDNYKVSDDLLTSTFRIFNAQDFESVASQYDAILYEFGNSEFHAHMLPLLEKYPGIVGLHDAYLSGLFGYLDFNLSMRSYNHEVLNAHGTAARYYFAPVQKNPNPIGETMVNLPCTKRILDNAIGIISHSPFNLELARSNYPEGWQAPYRIISQMISVPAAWTEEQKIEARKQLGFRSDDFIITTLGHITWTKWGDRLFEAFQKAVLCTDKRVHLVFAGELAKDGFGQKLGDAIQNSELNERVHITGFLSNQDYERYLRISDLAIQLRTKSRGGTPRGVLDCLARGVPVVVNNDASYTDYPANVVIKLAPEPSIAEIAQTLDLMYAETSVRNTYGEAGIRYVREYHDPTVSAAAYASAIHEFIERHHQTQAKNYITPFAPHLAGCSQPVQAGQLAGNWLENIPSPSFKRRKLLIDVSHIAQFDHKTGIQRVVKEIVRGLYCSEENSGIEPVAVELVNGSLHVAAAWLQSQNLLLSTELDNQEEKFQIEFQPGDILLMLDSSWERYREFFPIFEQARLKHVPIYTAVYDLLPITLPTGNFVTGGKEWFEGWFREAINASDGFVCISRSTADDVRRYIDSKPELTNRPRIGYWHLGSNFENVTKNGNHSQAVKDLTSNPYLLMIGTIEPRKNHAIALDAMEHAWKQGSELSLCIIGKEGWMVENLMKRLRNHPLAGKKLFIFENLNDTELHALYANASGLLFLSKGEGFGLPLIEAAHHNIPIICSDIPVFHEISGDFATYVSNFDTDKLANELKEWWSKKQAQQLPDTRLMPRLSWEQSGKMLFDVVINNNWIRSNE